ncbi:uncharacterized protein LOC104882960 [Beta vulgaris subsp. vulgaris]|uniref:uncharacterized protein LOC104882960 n=1 Tax=Beta vulgaris subsp. vulgaris TaxID=3555 RepID=UPI002549AD4E|nr:uncharacterized protein LOC104882960 [Beta vulgaris subsp. vulgaris]
MESYNRDWMLCKKNDPKYRTGVKKFLEFAFTQGKGNQVVPCPCVKCNNERRKTRSEIELDLLKFGIVKSYTRWVRHSESFECQVDANALDDPHQNIEHNYMSDMLYEAFGMATQEVDAEVGEAVDAKANVGIRGDPSEEAKTFYKLMEDLELLLYPGCKNFSKLSFLLKLFHIKCLGGITDKSLSMILDLFKEALPENNTLPESFYEAQKTVKKLSLNSIKIDACPNNCMLFWKEHANADECMKCHASRWKKKEQGNGNPTTEPNPKKLPCQTMRYFPLIPRLQRMFMSSKTAASMRWHSDERQSDDGVMTHPADSKAWKSFDDKYPSFASETRNVRLGLASDSFSPFRNGHIPHNTWPVVLIPYNLPPWLCMKQHFLILSTLIPGPKGPKKNIDVYLQPLIEELKLLWNVGVETNVGVKNIDVDYPAYGDLSGWSTGGEKGCSTCNSDTSSEWLRNGGKYCYMCHRRLLPIDHEWRYDGASFDGTHEIRPKPKELTGEEVLEQLVDVECVTSLETPTRKRNRRKDQKNKCKAIWRKLSIFYELPYWSSLLVRHNLDVMHIQKNVCETLLATLLDIEGKSKDNLNARHDLKEMKIRKSQHGKERDDGSWEIPLAPYTLSFEEKKKLCTFLTRVKFPDGYASNISRNSLLRERKLAGLKSHDYHVIMEHLLPLAIRDWPKSLSTPLIKLSSFLKELCSKTLNVKDLEIMDKEIAVILCELEKIFPPAFFVIMIHLSVHLTKEAMIAGPVQYRWMYPIERYMEDIETQFNKEDRVYDCDDHGDVEDRLPIFKTSGRAIGKVTPRSLTTQEWEDLHFYVLNNYEEVKPFIE